MENYNNEVFSFGNEVNNNVDQATNFNYNDISGLGESNYENEDLFKDDVVTNQSFMSNDLNYGVSDFGNVNTASYPEKLNAENGLYEAPQVFDNTNNIQSEPQPQNSIEPIFEPQPVFTPEVDPIFTQPQNVMYEPQVMNVENPQVESVFMPITEPQQNTVEPQTVVTENISEMDPVFTPIQNENPVEPVNTVMVDSHPEITPISIQNEVVEEPTEMVQEVNIPTEIEEKIEISDTPIEELNQLTSYEKETIESTDINSLFDKVSVNVKDASDIFRKNTEMKQKIDSRFEQLKKLQSELENSRQKQIDEVNSYKEEVLEKLTEKKEEIEKRLNLLKDSQAALEKKMNDFEDYKKKEQENIDRVQKEVQAAYDDRREELNHIEDSLRKQKDALDEERNQLSLDRIQYEADKNELANNLLKFNELVNSFTSSVNGSKE